MSKKIFWGGHFDDVWWLEHLEGENVPSMKRDLEMLLKNSPADRKRLQQLEGAKRFIKDTDDVALPEDAHYYDRLHDKIMAAIDENEEVGETDLSQMDEEARMSWTAVVWNVLGRRLGVREFTLL